MIINYASPSHSYTSKYIFFLYKRKKKNVIEILLKISNIIILKEIWSTIILKNI